VSVSFKGTMSVKAPFFTAKDYLVGTGPGPWEVV
jgi:hypothetical protein